MTTDLGLHYHIWSYIEIIDGQSQGAQRSPSSYALPIPGTGCFFDGILQSGHFNGVNAMCVCVSVCFQSRTAVLDLVTLDSRVFYGLGGSPVNDQQRDEFVEKKVKEVR